MSPRYKFFVSALIVFILVGMILSACASPSEQPLLPTDSLNRVATFSGIPTEVQTITTMEPTKTRKPRATIRIFVPSATPFASPNPTDVAMYAQITNALEATTTLISSLPNASRDEIAKALLIKWLNYYKTDKVDPYFRLKDYKIEEVSATSGYCPPPDKDTTKFAARVKFSVQTVTPHPGDWVSLPGNITLGEENWIYQLSPYVSVSTNNGTYTFGMEGSMPCG